MKDVNFSNNKVKTNPVLDSQTTPSSRTTTPDEMATPSENGPVQPGIFEDLQRKIDADAAIKDVNNFVMEPTMSTY